ncbi:bile acid:sodium symporter [Microbacterium sp. cx-55]|uniref:arsenic resistance protein n=1 Tax=Microbacterium sp. cx-55 TaxID=2875948 RepID=UPI001CBC8EE2|nr:bile acid:sodium symporter [Microbacterium sp. cx-55]MBZ4486586.1 bile acid:sodium symporter [Microbacterium sp. cx-55]UGB36446.1 bile acid:sodium symporter [Microbacterium sp. cx-55]
MADRRGAYSDVAERHQVALYLLAIALGAGVGITIPASAALEVAIEPALGALLFVTFLTVPFRRIRDALGDRRFLLTLGLLNFVVVPCVVYGLSRFVAGDQAMLIGVLLVLLTPCVDYVIVFTRIAGGASDRLLAAAPLLMVAQLLLLPGYLWAFAGADALATIDAAPFIRAFLVLIALPLGLAILVQLLAARIPAARRAESGLPSLMVPLMMLTLGVVVASQVRAVGARLSELWGLLPLYAAFVVVMIALGWAAARVVRADAGAARALIFSGVTRNSLVVLPLALALPPDLSLAPLVVVTQTLVELVAMIIMVRVVPRLAP